MKKTLFALIALAVAAAGCNKAEVISVDRQAIAFGEAFVDNATKADYNSTTLIDKFKVYGTVTGNQNTIGIYNGADVTRGTTAYGKAWACSQTEYWIPNCTYAFEAVVDGEISDGKIAYSIGQDLGKDGVSDLLYASASATTDATATPTGSIVTDNGNPVVAFQFKHLLSKLQFTFINGIGGKYSYNVTSVSIKGHDADGSYNIATGEWDNTINKSTTALSFGTPGSVTSAEVISPVTNQIIPGNQTLTVAINYDIYYDGKNVSPGISVSKDLNYTFVKNYTYNIDVTLPAPGKPISFTVNETEGIGDWAPGGDVNLDKE